LHGKALNEILPDSNFPAVFLLVNKLGKIGKNILQFLIISLKKK